MEYTHLSEWGDPEPSDPNDPDPGLAFNCPRCHRRLTYVRTIGEDSDWAKNTHVYQCPVHGRWELVPELGLRSEPERYH